LAIDIEKGFCVFVNEDNLDEIKVVNIKTNQTIKTKIGAERISQISKVLFGGNNVVFFFNDKSKQIVKINSN
jgi:hypothetical protein